MFKWFREPKPIIQKAINLVPLVWLIVKTVFRTMSPEGIGIALVMSMLDILSFELLIIFFIYILTQLGPNPRRFNWNKVLFYICVSLIPLVVADVTMPLAQMAAYAQFPTLTGGYSFEALQTAVNTKPLYQLVAFGPFIWSVVCTVAFFPPFIYGMKFSLNMKWHIVIPFAITIAVISWVLGSVVAGIPFGGFTGA